MTKHLADIAGEGVLLAGGGRAILLQVANPAVGRGVARHSDFAANPLLRLRNTLTYIYVIAYGTPDEIARITGLVNATHTRVRGSSYDAVDPELQLWVAATLYDTAITLHEQIFGPLTPDDADAVYQDYAVLGSALQMPRELWPADRNAFRGYWDAATAALHTDDETRAIARDVLHPSRVPLWLRAIMPFARLVTAGLLTTEQRVLYGLAWSERDQERYDRAIRMTAALYPRLPKRLRCWPRDHYLRQFRARSAPPS